MNRVKLIDPLLAKVVTKDDFHDDDADQEQHQVPFIHIKVLAALEVAADQQVKEPEYDECGGQLRKRANETGEVEVAVNQFGADGMGELRAITSHGAKASFAPGDVEAEVCDWAQKKSADT